MFKLIVAYKVGGIWVEESINWHAIEALSRRAVKMKASHFLLKGIEKWKI